MDDQYYIFDCGASPIVTLHCIGDACPESSWIDGVLITCDVHKPFRVRTRSGHEYKMLEFYSDDMAMRADLVEALREAGVDNLQAYDLIINKESGEEITNYKVVNIIGVVSAVDYGKTTFNPDNPSRFIDASIDSLAIDPHKASGLLMFRLKESITTILIHASIKQYLEARRDQFPYLNFTEPKDYKCL